MKKILVFAIGLLFTGALIAQDTSDMRKSAPRRNEDKKYCAVLQSGKTVLTLNGKTITWEVKLANGTRVSATGQLTKKDGRKVNLIAGECVDKDGNLLMDEKMGMTNQFPTDSSR